MKKIITIFILLLLSTIVIFAQESVAFTLKVNGEVELSRNEKTTKTKTGEVLYNKDQLESKEDSYAAVKFVDGSSVVKLFPNSILKIYAEKDGKQLNKKSYLQVGDLWSKVIKKTGVFEIETPTTVVSVKGTNFYLKVNERGFTELYTLEGKVKITNKKDGKSAVVEKGKKALSNGEMIEVKEIVKGDIKENTLQIIEEDLKWIKFPLKNDQGEKRDIEIEFE